VLVLGDSTAVALSDGMFAWSQAHPGAMQVASLAHIGCGLVRNSVAAGDTGGAFQHACDRTLGVDLPTLLGSQPPDLVVVLVTLPDAVPRVWSSTEGAVPAHDPRYAARMLADYRALASWLLGAGVHHIAWLMPAYPTPHWMGAGTNLLTAGDFAALGRTVQQMAVDHPGDVTEVRFDDWMAANDTNGMLRADGLHLSPDGAVAVMDRYLGDLLVRIARM
jgi:lysophospholipase L1-like esterase